MIFEYCLPSGQFVVEEVKSLILHNLEAHTSISQSDLLKVGVAFEEAALNAHEHGNLELESCWKEEFSIDDTTTLYEVRKNERMQDSEFSQRKIQVQVKTAQDSVELKITDDGDGFDHRGVQLSAAVGRTYGMGLVMINSLVDEVKFLGKGNQIVLTKRW